MENQTLYSLLMKAAKAEHGWDFEALATQAVHEEWKAGRLGALKWSEVLWNLEGALLAIKDEGFRALRLSNKAA